MEEAKVEKDFTKINEYIKEYLNFNNYGSTLECFEAEEKTKKVTARDLKEAINKVPTVSHFKFQDKDMDRFPRMYRFYETDSQKTHREETMEKDHTKLQKKHQDVLNSARQIFAIAIKCLQHLHSLKDDNAS